MQGQRSTVESFPETFEFDRGPTTNNSSMDQQVYWNNLPLNPVETQNSPDYLLSPSGTNLPYVNATSQPSAGLNIWNSGGPSSGENPQNQSSHDETKTENGRSSSLTSNGGSGPRIEERRFETSNMLSSENVNINLNNNQIENNLLFSQYSNSSDIPQNSDKNVGNVGTSSQVLEVGLCPHPVNLGLSESKHVPSSSGPSNRCGDLPSGGGVFPEDGEGRSGGALDGRRLCGKRKNIEGVPGQCSASGSSSCFRQSENSSFHSFPSHHNPITSLDIPRSSDFLSGVSPAAELNPRIGTDTVEASGSFPGGVTGNAESSHRNFRMRISPADQHDTGPPNLWAPGNATGLSNVWSTNQPSSLPAPFNHALEYRPLAADASSQSQLHVPAISGLVRSVQSWNGSPNLRIGSSSSSPISSGERLAASREEIISRTMQRNSTSERSVFVPTTDSTSEHSVFIPTTDTRQSVPVLPTWVLANGTASMPGSVASATQASSSSGVHQSQGPAYLPHQNPPTQFHRGLSEAVLRPLFSSGSSASGGQSFSVSPQRSVQSSTSQDIGRPSGVVLRGQQQRHTRSAMIMDRQRESVPGVPVSMRSLAAAREGRSRMITEHLRNVIMHRGENLQMEHLRNLLMHRGENLRIEDVLLFDQAVFFGAADLLDRHRDMRLDVDNMSYEELLALEEQIGNVSTGLSEENVLKCVKQREYVSGTVEASTEVEPCCICQEEYVDGEELGTLDCGHDYHTACIKQWLMLKNLCPICKTAALS